MCEDSREWYCTFRKCQLMMLKLAWQLRFEKRLSPGGYCYATMNEADVLFGVNRPVNCEAVVCCYSFINAVDNAFENWLSWFGLFYANQLCLDTIEKKRKLINGEIR